MHQRFGGEMLNKFRFKIPFYKSHLQLFEKAFLIFFFTNLIFMGFFKVKILRQFSKVKRVLKVQNGFDVIS